MTEQAKETGGTAALKAELQQVQRELAQAYNRFNCASAPALVEASIYEIQALNARYGYYHTLLQRSSGENSGETAQ